MKEPKTKRRIKRKTEAEATEIGEWGSGEKKNNKTAKGEEEEIDNEEEEEKDKDEREEKKTVTEGIGELGDKTESREIKTKGKKCEE